MAAATVNSGPVVDYWGKHPMVELDVTWTDSDTYTSPDLGAIQWGYFVPTTNASYGLTLSANVATFKSGGALTGKLVLFGNVQ